MFLKLSDQSWKGLNRQNRKSTAEVIKLHLTESKLFFLFSLSFLSHANFFLLETINTDLGYSRKDEETGVVAFHLLLQKDVQKEHESLLHSALCEVAGIKKKSEVE